MLQPLLRPLLRPLLSSPFEAGRGRALLPLDNLTTAAAYSTRKLRTAYAGSALRVRRSSDNTEQDIGFSGGDLDTAAMLTFVGANNGFITVWYDQSGNARNMVQVTAANQPRIVDAGVSIGAASVDSGTAQRLVATNAAFGLAASALTICSAMQAVGNGSADFGCIYGLGAAGNARILAGTTAAGRDLALRPAVTSLASSPLQTFSGSPCTLALTKTATANLSAIQTRVNNGSASTYAASAIAAMDNTFGINNTASGALSVSGIHQHYEHIVFAEQLSTDQLTTIARSQGAYYGITVA